MRLGWFRFPTGCFCFCRVSKAIQRVFRLFLFWCVASKYLGFDVEQNSNDILKKGLVFALYFAHTPQCLSLSLYVFNTCYSINNQNSKDVLEH